MKTDLEATFDYYWRVYGGPALVEEYRFHPERKWRFDRALPDKLIAIEIEGGIHSGGRHTRGKGFTGDCEKYNQAVLLGWRVFRFTSDMFDNPDRYILPIVKFAKE
jgi:hypothetical protein